MPNAENCPYVYVNEDGTARELHPNERQYLETEFLPGTARRRISSRATAYSMAGVKSEASSSDRNFPRECRYRMRRSRIQAGV